MALSQHRHFPTVILAVSALVLCGLGVWKLGSDGPDRVAAATSVDPAATPAPSAPASTTPTGAEVQVAPTTAPAPPETTTTLSAAEEHPLPAGSGEGRRVVFSVSGQRMWWVDDGEVVLRTAAVSGRENTPATGTFQVYSRSERATGLDGSSMNHFVRFTHGPNGWAIGFHDIPVVDGVPAQTMEQLGTPLSHGCIRQSPEDARFTWDFLQVGDTVVVVA